MKAKPLYLDYMSTTPLDHRVVQRMLLYMDEYGDYGNPSSMTHTFGSVAAHAVEEARENVANLINAQAKEIIWTSGATEAINLAIKGAAQFYKRKGKHIITCVTEHKAVIACCNYLIREGFEITYLNVSSTGLIDIENLRQAIRKDTILVSILHVNNEIGVIQDIATIGKLCREKGILFHVDAAQSFGKIPLDMQAMPIDLLSCSGHKIYGPKGIGALYIRSAPKVHLEPQLHGGGQEQGLRGGTLATHQIVGMGEAAKIAREEMDTENERLLSLRNSLWSGIRDLPGVFLNGDLNARLAGNLNVCFSLVDGEALLYSLQELALSSGSACTSAQIESSHVLRALGLDEALGHSSIRISLGRFIRDEDIDYAISLINERYLRLVDMAA